LVLLVVLWAVPALAQPALPKCEEPPAASAGAPAPRKTPTYQQIFCDHVIEIYQALNPGTQTGQKLGIRDAVTNAIDVQDRNWRAFLLYAQARSSAVDASPVEEARTDKQVGAPAGAGSSSVVSKGAVPGILGFAVENGALTQSTSGTTATLRGNLVGWLDLLKNQEFIASYQDGSRLVRNLRRVSYSLTLNTDTGAATEEEGAPSSPAAVSPEAIRARLDNTKQQLAGYSVRVAIVDQRDPRTTANRAAIATFSDTEGAALLRANNAFDAFLKSPEYNSKWVVETVDALVDPARCLKIADPTHCLNVADPRRSLSIADIQRIFYQRIEQLRLLMINRIEGFDETVAGNLLAYQAYDKARMRLYEAMRKRPLFALEYVNARTKDLPDSSTLRLILESNVGSRIDLTANAAWTFQNEGSVALPEPRSIGGRRDFQLAGQMDVPLGSLAKRLAPGAGIGPPVFAVGFLSQKLTERAAVSFAGNEFTVEPGWLHAVQAKVTVPVKGSGVKVPLSVTYSNRTELLKEKEVRGHIGLTFDLDVLSSLVRR
jgi:hypothetical protein